MRAHLVVFFAVLAAPLAFALPTRAPTVASAAVPRAAPQRAGAAEPLATFPGRTSGGPLAMPPLTPSTSSHTAAACRVTSQAAVADPLAMPPLTPSTSSHTAAAGRVASQVAVADPLAMPSLTPSTSSHTAAAGRVASQAAVADRPDTSRLAMAGGSVAAPLAAARPTLLALGSARVPAELALAQPQVLTPQGAPALAPVVDGQARRPVDLRAAMKLAAEKNTDLMSVRATVDTVKAQAGQVWGAVLPEIVANGSLVYTTAPAPFDLGGLVGLTGSAYNLGEPTNPSVIPKPISIVADKSAYATVQVTQILFTPSMLLLPAAWSAPEAARLGLMEAREQILLAVARVYLGLEGIREIEAAARDAEAVALKRERDAQAQLSAGTAIEVAVLRAQAETAQARRTQAELAASRLSLLAALEVLTGESVAPAEGAAPLATPVPQEESATPWEKTYGIQSAAKTVETVETQVGFDRFQWAPTLLAQVKGSYNSNAGFSGRNFAADFILALSFPIFDRGARYAKLHEDEARLMDAQAKLTGGRLKAKAAWQTARANLASAEAVLKEAQAQASLTVRAQKQVEGAVRAGFTTALEQSDIDNKAFFARSSAAQARVQVEVRKVELVVAEGKLAALLELRDEP